MNRLSLYRLSLCRAPSGLTRRAAAAALTSLALGSCAAPQPGSERHQLRGHTTTLTITLPELPAADWTGQAEGSDATVARGTWKAGQLKVTLDPQAGAQASRVPRCSGVGNQLPGVAILSTLGSGGHTLSRAQGSVQDVWVFARSYWTPPEGGLKCGDTIWTLGLREGWNLVRRESVGGPDGTVQLMRRAVRPTIPGPDRSDLAWSLNHD